MSSNGLSWRGFLVALALAVAALPGIHRTVVAGEGRNADVRSRPDIILILADDMGFSDLGCYGSEINTPNLDQLGAGGLRFTQFYNAARCCPSRASLLTGLYPHQAGIGHMLGRSANYTGDLSRNAITLAEGLKLAGYFAYMAGKWHVTPWRPNAPSMLSNGPTGRGFDRFYGIIQSIRSYYNPPSLMEDGLVLPPPQGDYHFTDAVTEHAVEYIKNHPADKPYFLYASYAAPHFPLHAREADVARYRGRFKAGWEALRKERHRRLVELKFVDPVWPLPPRDEQELPWEDTNPAYRDWFDERMAVYAAMIEQMDRGVGAILDAVKAPAIGTTRWSCFSRITAAAPRSFTPAATRPRIIRGKRAPEHLFALAMIRRSGQVRKRRTRPTDWNGRVSRTRRFADIRASFTREASPRR